MLACYDQIYLHSSLIHTIVNFQSFYISSATFTVIKAHTIIDYTVIFLYSLVAPLHGIALNCVTLHRLHSTALHCIALLCVVQHRVPLLRLFSCEFERNLAELDSTLKCSSDRNRTEQGGLSLPYRTVR